MAGHASGWHKISSGPRKGQSVFVSKQVQMQFGGLETVLASLDKKTGSVSTVIWNALSISQPGNLALKGGAIAGTESQQQTTTNIVNAEKQLASVRKQLRATTDLDKLTYLRERQKELDSILQSLNREERLTQLDPDQKALLRKATELFGAGVKERMAEEQSKLDAARVKLKAAKSKEAKEDAQYGVDVAEQMLSLVKDMQDQIENDLAALTAPYIPGRKQVTLPSTEDVLAGVPLTQAEKASLLAPVAPIAPAASVAKAPKVSQLAQQWNAPGAFKNATVPTFSFVIGKSNNATLRPSWNALELEMATTNAKFVQAFAERFGAKASAPFGMPGTYKTVTFSWPSGQTYPSTAELEAWLQGKG